MLLCGISPVKFIISMKMIIWQDRKAGSINFDKKKKLIYETRVRVKRPTGADFVKCYTFQRRISK